MRQHRMRVQLTVPAAAALRWEAAVFLEPPDEPAVTTTDPNLTDLGGATGDHAGEEVPPS